ncbi:unnamed protein product [Ranitomeya imitator]|uniref:Uncharacterized protein n=1 Tax=Ranitomeya imitator TaxID=111125 RepID=A0ABN9LZK2_9NEOB|nr:unnamed protein product [Ranitomeya imitator]
MSMWTRWTERLLCAQLKKKKSLSVQRVHMDIPFLNPAHTEREFESKKRFLHVPIQMETFILSECSNAVQTSKLTCQECDPVGPYINGLQTRVQQLQADEHLPACESKRLLPHEELGNVDENQKTVQTPKRWMEKLKNEQIAKHQKQKALNGVEYTSMASAKREANQAQGNKTKSATELQKHSANQCPLPANEDLKIADKAVTQTSGLLLEDKEGNRHGGVQQNIHCYLETCIFLGDMSRAQSCLQFYHQHALRRGLLNISMYNLLMKAWAKEASLSQVGRLFVMLQEASLKPNLGSYAAALEAMGRSASNQKAIQRCLNQMEEHGLSVDGLFQGLPYIEDERDMVLKAIRQVMPNFVPSPKVPIVCTSSLVKDFYTKEPPPSYSKMGFTVSELQERFEEQLKIESSETVTINSVEAVKPVHEERTKAVRYTPNEAMYYVILYSEQ